MKAEQLKVIAEGMGYEAHMEAAELIDALFVMVTKKGWSYHNEYNPLTNAEQCMEIMEELIEVNNGCNLLKDNDEYHITDDDWHTIAKAETIPEAVCNAAYEYFKDKR